ncbi:MAG: hypothetical protein D6713_04965 [Deltaproteobacteria bacterium]|nr:MAG: hypothetical protein D6713_04965 [Deltaproteobacteria bacterium]
MAQGVTFGEVVECLSRPGLSLFCGREFRGPVMAASLFPLLRGGRVVVVDGGNMFDPYVLSRACRMVRVDPSRVFSRVFVARGFTCHQVERLVTSSLPRFVREHPPSVLVAMGILESFYDADVSFREASRLFGRVRSVLRGLARHFPLPVVSPPPPLVAGGRRVFFRCLAEEARSVYGLREGEGGRRAERVLPAGEEISGEGGEQG